MTSGYGTLISERKTATNGESLDASLAKTNSSLYSFKPVKESTLRSQGEYVSSYGSVISGNANHWLASDGMTTYQVPFTTSTMKILSRFDEQEREFRVEVLIGQVFGAFYQMCIKRKAEDGLTRAKLGERMAKDKSHMSKLLDSPKNWTLRTIAEFANALEMDFHFFLSDRKHPGRVASSTGVEELNPPILDLKPVILEGATQIDAISNSPKASTDSINFKRAQHQGTQGLIQHAPPSQHGLS